MVRINKHDGLVIVLLLILCISTLVAIVLVQNTKHSSPNNTNTAQINKPEDTQTEQPSSPRENITSQEETTNTPAVDEEVHFTYSKHQACGIMKNVYCVLLDDFNPNLDWQQIIRVTTSYFIKNELGGGSTTDFLIYFFQNEECYQQKIATKATEMCGIPNGEVAASSWGKFSYEYKN